MARFSTQSLARASGAHPWRTIGAWIVALVLLAGVGSAVFPLLTTADVHLTNNPESEQGWAALIDHGIREERSGAETVIVRSSTTTVDDPAFQSVVQATTDSLRTNPDVVASAVNFLELQAVDPNA